MNQEKILGVAFKLIKPIEKKDTILKDSFPTNHLLFLNKLFKEGLRDIHAIDGFYSNKREFLTRQEALDVAKNASQLLYPEINNDRLYAKHVITPKKD